MARKALLVNVFGELMTIPKSPSIPLYERGKKSLPFSKGESEGICSIFLLN